VEILPITALKWLEYRETERLQPPPILRVYLGDRASPLRTSTFTAEAQYISDDTRSALEGYTAYPVVKKRDSDNGYTYFIFDNLCILASAHDCRYGQTPRRGVLVVDGGDRREMDWYRLRMRDYERSGQG